MANKISWYISVDWKTVTGIIGVATIVSIVVFIIILPNIVQNNKLERYLGETTGTITEITENTEMDQGHQGTRIYIGSYTVNYHYIVNGETYRGTERIKATPNATKVFSDLLKDNPSRLIVRYDEADPSMSTIRVK